MDAKTSSSARGSRPAMSWVTVADERGHRRLEMRWALPATVGPAAPARPAA